MYEYFQLATKPKGYTKATLTTKYKYEQKTKLNNSNVEREDKLEVHETISSSALCHSYQRHNQPRSRQSNINVQALMCGAIGRCADLPVERNTLIVIMHRSMVARHKCVIELWTCYLIKKK